MIETTDATLAEVISLLGDEASLDEPATSDWMQGIAAALSMLRGKTDDERKARQRMCRALRKELALAAEVHGGTPTKGTVLRLARENLYAKRRREYEASFSAPKPRSAPKPKAPGQQSRKDKKAAFMARHLPLFGEA